jgi:4-amino-4-deoxy-L-arabinose transferase-like glycosyltransferase
LVLRSSASPPLRGREAELRTTAVPKQSLGTRPWVFLGVLTACLCGSFLLFYRLGDRDLWASHEARAGQNAQRILDDGDWLLPRQFDDKLELQKPPLYYWLTAIAGWARGGVDAIAVRIPAAVAGLATIVGILVFLAANGRPLAGILAALFLATANHFTWIVRTGRIDVPLTFTTAAAILCLWTARHRDDRPTLWSVVGYLAIAAGVLLKGPIGLILPLAVLTIDGLMDRSSGISLRRRMLPSSLLWGLPLVFAVAAPWFVIAHIRTDGEFTRQFFWYHNFQRATGGAALASHPWWFYGPRIAFDFLPWSPLIVFAAWFTFRARGATEDPVARLGVTWLFTILFLLSLSKFKRADYLLPAYPGVAVWLGCVGERLYQRWRLPNRARWLALGACGAMAAIVAGWALFLNVTVPQLDAEREKHSFAAAIRAVAPRPEQVLFFRVEDHLLAFHLGRPLNSFLEWENLSVWMERLETHHVLMPAECANEWRQYITSGSLDEVLRYCDRTDRHRPRDLVLMRTHPGPKTNGNDGPADRPTAGKQGTGQHAAAGLQPGGGTGADR